LSDLQLTVVFVTHDLDEALYLAQRVITLSASPGTIVRRSRCLWPIQDGRSRRAASKNHLELRESLFRTMVTQVMAGRADGPRI
jgi:ABC-type nitrate/sulfonate/bicarbonate transport system ATPase subunit